MNRSMFVRVLTGTVLVTGIWGLVELSDGQQQVFAQEKKAKSPDEGKKGSTVGVLVEKGKGAIFVRGDGEVQARRFVPEWKGGAPAQGGGLDKEMLKVFEELKVGSRIEVDWVFHERLRALKVKVIKQADTPKEQPKDRPEPKEVKNRTGTTTGTLVAHQAGRWIEVKGDGEEKARRYWVPRNITKLQEAVRNAPVGSRVAVGWEFTGEGPKAVSLEVLRKPRE